ncbi:hypothetical protein GCM10022402_00890 [Salinactinospora qingdaonensis]|uniref:Uncharacterized protein n=1 Tax=Salinactinospora qingdaonensis TaxID=702744 RepID=A0ABP7ETN5_9ACTN
MAQALALTVRAVLTAAADRTRAGLMLSPVPFGVPSLPAPPAMGGTGDAVYVRNTATTITIA